MAYSERGVETVNVLLVEDRRAEAALIREILVSDDYASFEVTHVPRLSTVEDVATDEVDVVLLDLHLPDSQGLETCTRMMEMEPELPIVVLSSLDDRALAVEAVRRGAQDYLVKGELRGDLLSRAAKHAIERKRIEETLRQRTAELTARNRELDAFAHTVAHDLRNPLSLTLGFAEFLREHHGTMTVGEVDDLADRIVRSGKKVDAILDGLLLLASVRKADVSTGPLDMASITEDVIERLGPRITEAGAEIIVPGTWPVVNGYGPWVEEVWFNYVSNALKYGGERPRVELGVEVKDAADAASSMACFWVRDDGPGIAPEDQARLFTPFERLGQARIEGHGLGLSIVQRIVKRLDGEVGVDSRPGGGSTFYFTLPTNGVTAQDG
jgi:signal transduction histidine kinase